MSDLSTKEEIIFKRRASTCPYSCKVPNLQKITDIRDRFDIGAKIGEGTFGQVRLAVHRKLGLQCAIKIINK